MYLILALVTPIFTGTFLVCALSPRLHIVARIGYGTILGWSLLTIIELLTSESLQGNQTMLSMFAIGGIAAFVSRWRRPQTHAQKDTVAPRYSFSKNKLGWILLACLVWRVAIQIVPLLSTPLFPWDAWDFWARQVKHWYATGDLSFRLSAQYPPFVPLMQFWICKALGRFDDVLMNLPFLFIFLGTLLAMYGQLRTLGVSINVCLVATLVLTSLPIFSTHAALAGYADLPTAAAFCLGAMALVGAALSKSRSQLKDRVGGPSPIWWEQGALAIACAACVALYKRPGVFWTLLFLPALWLAVLPYVKRRFWWLCLLATVPPALWAIVYVDRARGYGMTNFNFVPHYEGNLRLMFDNMLLWDNYHLLWSVLLATFLISWKENVVNPITRPASFLIAATIAILALGMSMYLDFEFWSTVIARAMMHIAPSAVFLLTLLYVWRAVHGNSEDASHTRTSSASQ
jgi:hypothetical protein